MFAKPLDRDPWQKIAAQNNIKSRKKQRTFKYVFDLASRVLHSRSLGALRRLRLLAVCSDTQTKRFKVQNSRRPKGGERDRINLFWIARENVEWRG
jgi:hypothetical protein